MRQAFPAVIVCVAACSPEATPSHENRVGASRAPSVPARTPTLRGADGPFGFAMGQRLEGLGLKAAEKPGFYKTADPPRRHADFESVVLEAYPETGICQIRGIGVNLENDGDGSLVRAKVDEIAGAMDTKYGVSKLTSACSSSDVKCQQQFWMMTLNDGERFYGRGWKGPSDQLDKQKISQIVVAASALNIQTSFVVVEYHSAAVSDCERARKSVTAQSL